MVQRRSNLFNNQENTYAEEENGNANGSSSDRTGGTTSSPSFKQPTATAVALHRDARHRGQARARQISADLVKAASTTRQNSQKALTRSPSKRGGQQLARQRSSRLVGPRGGRTRRTGPVSVKSNRAKSPNPPEHGEASTSSCHSGTAVEASPLAAEVSPSKTAITAGTGATTAELPPNKTTTTDAGATTTKPKTKTARQCFRAKRAMIRDVQPKQDRRQHERVEAMAKDNEVEVQAPKQHNKPKSTAMKSPSPTKPAKESSNGRRRRSPKSALQPPSALASAVPSVEFSSVEFSGSFFPEKVVNIPATKIVTTNPDDKVVNIPVDTTKAVDIPDVAPVVTAPPSKLEDQATGDDANDTNEKCGEPSETARRPGGFHASCQSMGLDGDASAFNIQEARPSLLGGPALFGTFRSFTRA